MVRFGATVMHTHLTHRILVGHLPASFLRIVVDPDDGLRRIASAVDPTHARVSSTHVIIRSIRITPTGRLGGMVDLVRSIR